ncbi:MAG: TonB-dependent receptor [Steroidobacteraceae bacterium]
MPRLAATLIALLLASGAHAASPIAIEAGTRIATALDALRERGLRLVYSDALVPARLEVLRAVSGSDAERVASELLGPHGLTLRRLSGGVVAVVMDRGGPRWSVTGRVAAADGARPVAQARVELLADGQVAWTNANGEFRLAVRGRRDPTLRVAASGFAPRTIALHFDEAVRDDVTLTLRADRVALEQVTVLASRYQYESPTLAGPFALDRQDIIAQPKLAEDALQAMLRLPGIAYSGVSARPNVRGGEASEMLVTLDDMPIREPYHLAAYNSAFSALDESLIGELDAFTGQLPARYGNRLSGIVALRSAAADDPAPSAVGLSTFNARLRHGRAATDEGGPEWLAAARFGTLRSWIGQYTRDLGEPSYSDVFARMSRSREGTTLRAELLAQTSNLEFFDATTFEQAELSSEATYAWVSAEREPSERLRLSALLGFSRIASRRGGLAAGGLTVAGSAADSRSSHLWDLNLRAQWQASSRHFIDAGLAATLGEGSYDYTGQVELEPIAVQLFGGAETRQARVLADLDRNIYGAWVSDRWQLGARWFLEAGLRADHYGGDADTASTVVGPRLSLRFDVAAHTVLRAGWGRAFQAEEIHELRVQDGVTRFGPPQRVDQWVLSGERTLAPGIALRLELFQRDLPNPRARFENLLDPLRVLPELTADRQLVAPDSARSRGAEVSLQVQRGAWSVWSAYSWLDAVDRIAGESVPRNWDQRHTASTSLAWQRGPWSLSMLASYNSGRPTTALLDDRLASPLLGPRNGARLAHYATLDVRAAREFPVALGRLVVYGQVTNALNRPNRCCTELDLPDEGSDPLRLEQESVKSYPILPAFGISWEF